MKSKNSQLSQEYTSRYAYIYVRQSTRIQIYEHEESRLRQYELKKRAEELGWSESVIKTIDEDLGHSASGVEKRRGFQTLFSEVACGNVGGIFSLEVSRLSRQDSEWHKLVEICAVCNTLIIDESEVYNPRLSDDRLLLGLKGLLSSNELRQMSFRLWENRLHKAHRGELRINLPIGFIFDSGEGVELDPSQDVQDAVKLLFERFRLGRTISSVVRYFRENQLLFPKRKSGWDNSVEWGPLSCQRVSAILYSPIYAGAYVFGRKTTRMERKSIEQIGQKVVSLPPEQWEVTHWDAFEGYILKDEYDENQAHLLQRHGKHKPPTNQRRDGKALLTGMALCGVCGRNLHVRYSGRDSKHVTYLCNHRQRRYAEPVCQQIPGNDIDELVAKNVLAALTSIQLELSLALAKEIEQQQHSLRKQWLNRIEAARYAARLAERRYEKVDPDNRLVVSSLEQRWNASLEEVKRLEEQMALQMKRPALNLDSHQQHRLHQLVHDLPALWYSNTTTPMQQKELLQLLVADVTLTQKAQDICVQVRWYTNQAISFTIPLPQKGPKPLDDEIIQFIRSLAHSHTDFQIAHTLNMKQYQTVQGKEFTAQRVAGIRRRYNILKN